MLLLPSLPFFVWEIQYKTNRVATKHVLKSGKNQGFSDFQIAKFSYRKKKFRAAREIFSRTTGEDILFAVVGPQCGWSYFSLPPPQCLIQESRFQGGQLVLLTNIISSTADQGRH